jgi:glycosyltransferase involved in cell wall biosynthesis
MRIGFDGKRAVQNYTGLGNYSRYILEILSKYYPNNEYYIFAPKQQKNKRLERLLEEHSCLSMIWPHSILGKAFPSLWRSLGTHKLKISKIDLYHGLSNELPMNIRKSGIPTIVTIHDLIFLRYPDCYPFFDRKIYSYKFHKACVNSDHIIAVSECTKKDIIDYYNIPEDKISVIYQGCDESFTQPATDERKVGVQMKYHLPNRYILNVGRIEKRKNTLLIVKSMEKLPKDIHLVLVGQNTEYTKEIEKYIQAKGLQKRVTILNNVPFADLPAIYQQAELFVYPSIYEGFGIPIIEALNSRIPVIAAANSCLEEAGGPSSIYVDASDVEALTTSIIQILYSPNLRKQMIESGIDYAERFSEKLQAEKLIKLYQEISHQ